MDELSWDFRLVVPDGWYVWDPDPATRSERVAVAVDERLLQSPDLGPARAPLVEVLSALWRDADDQGALAAAALWEHAAPAAIAASLTVLGYEGVAPDGADGPTTLAGLADRCLEKDRRAQEGPMQLLDSSGTSEPLPDSRSKVANNSAGVVGIRRKAHKGRLKPEASSRGGDLGQPAGVGPAPSVSGGR